MTHEQQKKYRDRVSKKAAAAKQVEEDLILLEHCFSVPGAYGLPAKLTKGEQSELNALTSALNRRFDWDDSE